MIVVLIVLECVFIIKLVFGVKFMEVFIDFLVLIV